MRKITASLCDELVKIKISDELESLNVSNTAAVAFYHLSRTFL
jgi:tRNA G18 (ribose-2'-O)-methylase SpoU